MVEADLDMDDFFPPMEEPLEFDNTPVTGADKSRRQKAKKTSSPGELVDVTGLLVKEINMLTTTSTHLKFLFPSG